MGAWGYGILQNDTAQDGICEVARRIEEDIASLSDEGNELDAARLAAAVGLLLQFSPYSFNPESKFHGTLVRSLNTHREFFTSLPGNASQTLTSVIYGRGSELAERPAEIDPEVDRALHSDENEGFIMQKAFSVCDHDLFRHPAAAEYLQHVVDRIVDEVDEGFADDELVSDLSREAYFMGPFGLLLILPHCRVDPEKFVHWRERFHEVWKGMEPTMDETEKTFEDRYNGYLELAFHCGIKKATARE